MAVELFALTFDANDPRRLADSWAGVLDLQEADDPYDAVSLLPNPGTGFRLRFQPNPRAKGVRQNRAHVDLASASLAEQQATVDRVLRRGGQHYDVGQLPEEEHVVLADPEDNEFCAPDRRTGGCALPLTGAHRAAST